MAGDGYDGQTDDDEVVLPHQAQYRDRSRPGKDKPSKTPDRLWRLPPSQLSGIFFS
jgi:hypothetical protein